jgi:hypothetical protein
LQALHALTQRVYLAAHAFKDGIVSLPVKGCALGVDLLNDSLHLSIIGCLGKLLGAYGKPLK